MKKLIVTTGASLLVAGIVAGPTATSGTAATSRPAGHLVGAIVFVGRVPQSETNNRYHRGWVEIGQHGRLVAKQWVKVDHQYYFTLPPGTYDVAGYSHGNVCRDTARIKAGHTIHQNAYCSWH